jgi:hypothetical protein
MKITDEAAIKGMRDAVAERGKDWSYPRGKDGWVTSSHSGDPGSLYVRTDEDSCGCLVGLALHKAGVPLQWMKAREGDSALGLLTELGISKGVAHAANHAQMAQDSGSSWGRALFEFDAEHQIAAMLA